MRADAATAFAAARTLLVDARSAHAFPAAAVEVGTRDGAIWTEAIGALTYDAGATATSLDTVFDLASLTKVIATTSLAMRMVRDGALDLDRRVSELSPSWRGSDRAAVVMRQLLDHSSGLPAHARLFETISGRDAYESAIDALPLDRAPGSASVYSDPGFILLGLILERIGGAGLDVLLAQSGVITTSPLLFNPPAALRSQIAPTEVDAWRGRLIVGEVHDENAAALGGVAGHAGLFGTAAAVGAFARLVLETFDRATALGTPELMRVFATKTGISGSSRALGWDTMLPTSSCGTLMSPTSIGHTGFTGTSLWIDWERGVYVVLLTNRVHPSREPNGFAPLRAPVHDAVMRTLVRRGGL